MVRLGYDEYGARLLHQIEGVATAVWPGTLRTSQ